MSRNVAPPPIVLTAAQYRPNNPGILVRQRQRHRGDVLVAPGDQAFDPFAFAVGLILTGIDHRPGAMDQ